MTLAQLASLWTGPLQCFNIEHWYSPMGPANLFLTAGLGSLFSVFLAVVCYYIGKDQDESVAEEPGFEFNLNVLGAMCALLSGRSYVLAFFVRRDQVGTFILLRLTVLGLLATPMSLFCMACACWRAEEAAIVGSALWLGASVMQVYLYSCSGKSMWNRVFHRTCSCTRSGAETHTAEEEADVLIGGDEEGGADARDEQEGEGGGEGDEQALRARNRLLAGCIKVVPGSCVWAAACAV